MDVNVNVGRWDLVRFNFATLFKVRANLVMFLMIWAMAILIMLHEYDWSLSGLNIPVALLITFVLAVAGSLFFFTFIMIWMVLTVTEKSGWIGEHRFLVEDRGIREVTSASDSLHMWESIHDVQLAAKMLMIRVTQFTFLLLPKRGFDDPEQFEPFCAEVTKRWRDSQRA